MVTNPYFAIGDLQGCLESLDGLLEQLPEDAPLIFLGDLVNRGPESLATLRRVAGLGSRARCLLGNHDLHLLAPSTAWKTVRFIGLTGPVCLM